MSEDKRNNPEEIYIKVTKDGPYLVYGNPKITQEYIATNEHGASWEYEKGKEWYCWEFFTHFLPLFALLDLL